MRGEAGEGRGGGGEGDRGGSQATCTRQQPPTSEELIINLLSPSLECRSNSTTFASLSPASLSRSPPSPASLRPSAPVHSHSHPSSSPRGSSPPFPFLPDSPLSVSFPASPPFSLLSPSPAHAAPPRAFTITITPLSLSPLSLRGLAFDFVRPIDLQTSSLLFGLSTLSARQRDAIRATRCSNAASLKVEGLLSLFLFLSLCLSFFFGRLCTPRATEGNGR